MHPIKRIWGVRHIRWAYRDWRVHRWARRWAQMGIGLGVPNESDLRYLQAIWDGRA